MTTIRQIIKKSMQKIGVLVKQEDPTADEINDGLDALNAMLSSWSNDIYMVYARAWESFPLVANDGEYTIGTGGDFNTARPIEIVDAYTRLVSFDQQVTVVPDQIYALIENKSIQGRPEFLNFDNGYPLAKIRLYPVPDQAYTLFIQSEKELASYGLDDVVQLPAGWELALTWNLALQIAPEYGVQPDALTVENARLSRAAIATTVSKIKGFKRMAPMIGGFNVRTRGY